jgi:hypothetical protein
MQPLCSDREHGDARGQTREETFGPGLQPSVVEAYHQSFGEMLLEVGASDGTHQGKVTQSVAAKSGLELRTGDGELIGTADGTFGWFPVHGRSGRFRLTHGWALAPGVVRGAAQARTVWEFRSAPPEDPTQRLATIPPLLTVDYGPQVDLGGEVRARRPLELHLRVRHLAGAEDPGAITDGRLWWSTDHGRTWVRAKARSTGAGTFLARVPGPALRPGLLSLRVSASDSHANTVDQTSIDMLPIR